MAAAQVATWGEAGSVGFDLPVGGDQERGGLSDLTLLTGATRRE